MKALKVGDSVIIREGRELGRGLNPKGEIEVEVIEVLDSQRFKGICKNGMWSYTYHNDEIVRKGRKKVRFVFR
jgi:hypothetical protein